MIAKRGKIGPRELFASQSQKRTEGSEFLERLCSQEKGGDSMVESAGMAQGNSFGRRGVRLADVRQFRTRKVVCRSLF
jgi:hypothetical protein